MNKKIAWLLVFLIIITLFPTICLAISDSMITHVPTVAGDTNFEHQDKPYLIIENKDQSLNFADRFRLRLVDAKWNESFFSDGYNVNSSNREKIRGEGFKATVYNTEPVTMAVYKMSDQVAEIYYNIPSQNIDKDFSLHIPLNVDLHNDTGNPKITLDARDSNITSGTYVFARSVSRDSIIITADSIGKVIMGANQEAGEIAIEETSYNAIQGDGQIHELELKLPKGFVWQKDTEIIFDNLAEVTVLEGLDINPKSNNNTQSFNLTDTDSNSATIKFSLNNYSHIRGRILIKPIITVTKESKVGDVLLDIISREGNIQSRENLKIADNLLSNDIIVFEDINLELVIREKIKKTAGNILISDVAKITDLSANNKNIISLKGIEHLISLESLDLMNNQIKDIHNLNTLVNLKYLYLNSNKIENIQPIKNLNNLERLYLASNKITNIASLENLINLKDIYLNNNFIKDISPLVKANGLDRDTRLDISNNYLNLSSNSQNSIDIQTLLDRGMKITYLPQNTSSNGNGGSSGGGGSRGGGGGGGSSSTSKNTPNNKTTTDSIYVSIGNREQDISTNITTQVENNKKITKITFASADDLHIEKGEVCSIGTQVDVDEFAAEFNAEILNFMGENENTLQLENNQASYYLPIDKIDFDFILEQFGDNTDLKDIKINIKLLKTSENEIEQANQIIDNHNAIALTKPVSFRVEASHKDKTLEINNFNGFVEKSIVIPKEVNPNEVTTGIVVFPEGKIQHIPTKLIFKNDQHYATMSSISNSLYTIISHQREFEDMENHWSKDYVNEMASRMIISGVNENTFDPNSNITRVEFATIITKALGLNYQPSANPFTDLYGNEWYYEPVQTAYQYDLIKGYDNGSFFPEKNMTREEAMVIIMKAIKLTGFDIDITEENIKTQLNRFEDSEEISDWAEKSIAINIEHKIINASDTNLLNPKDYITRGEVATIVMKMLQNLDLIDR